jgi:hypothetical protein
MQRASIVVVVSRWLLLALAALAAGAAFLVARTGSVHAGVASAHALYGCPMHPSVTSSLPGDCPICRMALEPVAARASGTPTFTVPSSSEFRAFDAVSRTKPYDTNLEMRASAVADDATSGHALFFRDESALLAAGEHGTFERAGGGSDGRPAKVDVTITAGARDAWDGRTVFVHFSFAPGALSPSEVGSVKFATRLRTGLVVRESAIVRGPEGPSVLVVTDDRRSVTPRRVEIGNVLYGYAAIVSGLAENEYVAAKHVFSLDAERHRHEETGTP